MTKPKPKLRRCPFCGELERLTIESGEFAEYGLVFVKCENWDCSAEGPHHRTEAEARAAWNAAASGQKRGTR